MELDLLSLDSVARFAESWNSRSGPLHVLINNAGIFSIGGWLFSCLSTIVTIVLLYQTSMQYYKYGHGLLYSFFYMD